MSFLVSYWYVAISSWSRISLGRISLSFISKTWDHAHLDQYPWQLEPNTWPKRQSKDLLGTCHEWIGKIRILWYTLPPEFDHKKTPGEKCRFFVLEQNHPWFYICAKSYWNAGFDRGFEASWGAGFCLQCLKIREPSTQIGHKCWIWQENQWVFSGPQLLRQFHSSSAWHFDS